MDTAITISAISAIILCCSFGVAYRVYQNSMRSRKSDKFMELRIQVVELMGTAHRLKHNSQSLSKIQPTKYDKDADEKLDIVIDNINKIQIIMNGDYSSLSENDINNMNVSILNARRDLEIQVERIKKIQNS